MSEIDRHELDPSQLEVTIHRRAGGDEDHGRMTWGSGDTFEYFAGESGLGPGVLRMLTEHGVATLVDEAEVVEVEVKERD